MLKLRITRGPLTPALDAQILCEYSRLTNACIPPNEFRHWIREGPEGPAWHALLETDDLEIVGHAAVIPLRGIRAAGSVVAAKSDYFFVHEDFRKERVRGFENVFMPSAALLLGQLYRHCSLRLSAPILISAREELQPLLRLIGCRSTDLALSECLFILDPFGAAQRTPNLTTTQRAAFLATGAIQRAVATVGKIGPFAPARVRATPADFRIGAPGNGRIAFFEDQDSLRWRYSAGEYIQLEIDSAPDDYVIAKRSAGKGYLRICQWNLKAVKSATSIVRTLIRMASDERRLGVRWAVYKNGRGSEQLVSIMRKQGFLCAPRTRKMSFYSGAALEVSSDTWNIADSLFSFDP